ncbi:fluoride efflux transporter CrcB [Clostridium minihomine]|uniref:fluoride efflux transporter CrcB n=1 Tax=Clostridium minihomine TaxID=2045012 RepID=UPI000C762B23|nr:fluoride efflux transporter CrcB [Clostridium minihomine]
MEKCFYVGVGGCIGSICRYLLGLAFLSVSAMFPVNTLLINLLGSAVIGAISEFSPKITPLNPNLLLFLTTGICGGFTTFSTFSLETVNLLEKGRMVAGLGYAAASVVLCLIGVIMGKSLIRLMAG